MIRTWSLTQAINFNVIVVVYFIALRSQFSASGFGYLERGYWSGNIDERGGREKLDTAISDKAALN